MKVLVTGVAGQLGHDVMNELAKRGHEGVGSDLAAEYSGIADGSAVTKKDALCIDGYHRCSGSRNCFTGDKAGCCSTLRGMDCSGSGRG